MTVGADRTPPAALRDRVLAAARTRRAVGRPLPDTPPISGAEAFGRAVDALSGLLGVLDERQWRLPVLRDLDVQGLIGHLIGVQRDVQRALAADPGVACVDHVRSTQPAALEQAGLQPGTTRHAFRAAAARTAVAVAAGDPARVVAVHGMTLPLNSLLVVRAFELWTHENDIRRATGLPPSIPDLAALRLMTGLAVELLPHGMARAGVDGRAVGLHLVLTGGGGGTWDVRLGPITPDDLEGVPEVVIATDAVEFCRLVAGRLEPADLAQHITGAADRAPDVLAGARALALD